MNGTIGNKGRRGTGTVRVIYCDLSEDEFLAQVHKLMAMGGAENTLKDALWDLAQRLALEAAPPEGQEGPNVRYVLASNYDALAAELAALQRENKALRISVINERGPYTEEELQDYLTAVLDDASVKP